LNSKKQTYRLHLDWDCGNKGLNLHWTPTGFQPMDTDEYEYEL